MIPLCTKSVYRGKYLLQGWTPVLEEACGRACSLFKGMPKYLCHSDLILITGQTLESLGPVDKTA
jgi:hypothetical protein